jgi:glycosyltransferase involved in cell wall biosynthesis
LVIYDPAHLQQASIMINTITKSLAKSSIQTLVRCLTPVFTRSWKAFSKLIIFADGSNWVLSQEARELAKIARHLGINLVHHRLSGSLRNQSFFSTSQFILNEKIWLRGDNRIGLAYFHGLPGTGYSVFDELFDNLRKNHSKLERIQVSHSQMRDVVLSSGISPEKVFLIPIGINLSFFPMQSLDSKRRARAKYDIPQSAAVMGSFQKDGQGWGKGLEPKLIKGPDVFLKTIEILKSRIQDLFVLLSGPARGYVMKGLESLGVDFKHFYLKNYPETGELFRALDLYLVTSRQEGGPKAVLESMSSGVPLVTTRVGQAMDLVVHGENGWMVESEDIEGLAHYAEQVLTNQGDLKTKLESARRTAEANSYDSQIPLWHEFMRDFVLFQRT